MQRIVAALLCWILGGGLAAAETNPFPRIASAYLVQTGERNLWAGAADQRLPPASLTKIMTALLLLESWQPDALVTVSREASRETGSRLGLRQGERLTLEALFNAMLVGSANDACHALAEHHAGSITEFVARMNRRAEQLGLSNTRFANPCGFDAPGHFSSARDLARLARAALAFPEFGAVVARPEVRILTADGASYRVKNKNALIGNYAPALGVKTGFTSRAGRCLIALAQKDGVRVLVVMLNARSRWWDTIGLIENAVDAARADAAR